MSYFDRVDEAAAVVRARLGDIPPIAVVLGSGLGAFADRLDDATRVPYTEIPHWPASTVIGHAGTLVCGVTADHGVLTLAGRAHFYEGHDLRTVTFATRVLGRLGVKTLVLTNAAGGINTTFTPGTLMVIDDHINLMGSNPLVGPNDERFGVRFPDMSAPYCPQLVERALEIARQANFAAHRGVYAALTGPSYETRAESRFLRRIGADAVGMSTVPEVIVARHCGLRVLALSVVTNICLPDCLGKTSHEEVRTAAARAEPKMRTIVRGILAEEAGGLE